MKRLSLSKPSWLARRIVCGGAGNRVRSVLGGYTLHTVCEEAHCPNRGECHAAGTATFLILGDRCTRSCRFCAISHGTPSFPDPHEPCRIAEAVDALGLGHAVVTSVTRDDLTDGGATQFAMTIAAIREQVPGADIEVLIPDFGGSFEALAEVVEAGPVVLGHNIETVPRLYESVRSDAVYSRSLGLIERVRDMSADIVLKSGLMLGLGEDPGEVMAVLEDMRDVGCEILTIGQYLQPDHGCIPVERYIPPEEFAYLNDAAYEMGFSYVAAGPFVRSSYHAERALDAVRINLSGTS